STVQATVQHLIQQGFLPEAETILSQYAKLMPADPDTYSLTAMWHQAQGKLDQAVKALSTGLKAHPLRFDLTVNLGTLYEQDEQYLEAYHIYMRASYIAKDQEQEK